MVKLESEIQIIDPRCYLQKSKSKKRKKSKKEIQIIEPRCYLQHWLPVPLLLYCSLKHQTVDNAFTVIKVYYLEISINAQLL